MEGCEAKVRQFCGIFGTYLRPKPDEKATVVAISAAFPFILDLLKLHLGAFGVHRNPTSFTLHFSLDFFSFNPDSRPSRNPSIGVRSRERNCYARNWNTSKNCPAQLKRRKSRRMWLRNNVVWRTHNGAWRMSVRTKWFKSSKIRPKWSVWRRRHCGKSKSAI